MRDLENRKNCPSRKPPRNARNTRREDSEKLIENDFAVDRGERIATGKAIARAGGDCGYVPGAMASKD